MLRFHRHPDFRQPGIRFAVATLVMVFSINWAVPGQTDDGASIARGGRLFDSWFMEAKDLPPSEVHPEYKNPRPSMNGSGTSWRCASCHGWGYQGRTEQETDALSGKAGTDAAALAIILQDENHRYGDLLPQRDLVDLAAFLKDGLIDMAAYIETGSNRALGDSSRDPALYATICANCHGGDGQRITTMQPLGSFARTRPREALHKILNGHPAERMPPLRFLDTSRLGDMLAYIQTLPDKDLAGSITRGGRLYDNWQKETGAASPASRHPAYPRDAGRAALPEANWRCKECHGWDYKGRDGAYGQGPHRTGIIGIRAWAGSEPQTVVELLQDANHRYYGPRWAHTPLDLRDVTDLANFVTRGQIDMDTYIDPQTGVAKGNADRYRGEFNLLCATCHGKNGNALLTGDDIGDVARENPWEALHKLRNGHPNEAMPALLVLDMGMLVDILAYTQTLR